MLKRDFGTEWQGEASIALAIALGGEDKGSQPPRSRLAYFRYTKISKYKRKETRDIQSDLQVGEYKVDRHNKLAEGGSERRQESRYEKHHRENSNHFVEDDMGAMMLLMDKVRVDTHSNDSADPLEGPGGQEDGPGEVCEHSHFGLVGRCIEIDVGVCMKLRSSEAWLSSM